MRLHDNLIYKTVRQFIGRYENDIPEPIIFGFAKIVLMDEAQLKYIISEEQAGDLDRVRAVFSEKKIDTELIKQGLPLLLPYFDDWVKDDARIAFGRMVTDEDTELDVAELVKRAIEAAVIDIPAVFGQGRTMDDVLNCQALCREARAKQDAANGAEREGDAEDADESSPEPDDKKNGGGETAGRERKGSGRSGAEKKDTGKKASGKKSDKGPDGEEVSSGKIGAGIGAPKEIVRRDLYEVSEKCRALTASLMDVVKGQDPAILKFVRGYSQGELLKQTERGNHPRATFFFFGPPGVGKTLLAETAAETLGIPHKIFHMSEYSDHQAHEGLIGTSAVFSNAKEGTLTSFVRQNPECLLVFDEIEKAHLNVLRIFLQILGSGKMGNINKGGDVSFQDAIIIFTSNLGKELYEDRTKKLSALPDRTLISAIRNEKDGNDRPILPPELCSRIETANVVIFDHLHIRHLAGLVRSNFDRVCADLEKEYGCSVQYCKELPLLFLFGRGDGIDARVASGQSANFIKNEFYELMRQLENDGGKKRKISSVSIGIEWDGMDGELKGLFFNDKIPEVLIYAGDEDRIPVPDRKCKCTIHRTGVLADTEEILKSEISAVFVDPFQGTGKNKENVLSVADYATDGVRLFHSISEGQTGIPVFILDPGGEMSEADRRTFLAEGASGIVAVPADKPDNFYREVEQIMAELYMEEESEKLTQSSFVIGYKTKQIMPARGGALRILFYELRRRIAVEADGTIGTVVDESTRPKVRFDDVIGAAGAKEELRYYLRFLKNPRQFLVGGAKPPRGVLLYGPPGTGKTMLAQAMAGEAEVMFFSISAAEIQNAYYGKSEENVRKLFNKAHNSSPSIIFIDEIDAIGKKRTGSTQTAHTESILNQLLTCMQGFDSDAARRPVFVLAATNYGVREGDRGISSLDPALLRRFDKCIKVDLPTEEERKRYIEMAANKKGMKGITESGIKNLAQRTPRQSLAIMENILDTAYRQAVRNGREVTDNDLLTALEEQLHGEKRESTQEYMNSVAIHETGHAYVSWKGGDPPAYITIESRADFGGYMEHTVNPENTPSFTREDLLARIRTCLAGRAAEQVFFDERAAINTGASSDLEHATDLAFAILCAYGMDGKRLAVLRRSEIMNSSLADDYVKQVEEILREQMEETIRMIEEGRDKIRLIADELLKENRMTGDRFLELAGD